MSTPTKNLTLSSSFYRTADIDLHGFADPWLCNLLLRRAITLPANNTKITLVLSRQKPDNKDWYTFSRLGNIGDIRVSLCSSLKEWLADNWRRGYRFGHVEYRP